MKIHNIPYPKEKPKFRFTNNWFVIDVFENQTLMFCNQDNGLISLDDKLQNEAIESFKIDANQKGVNYCNPIKYIGF